jgi:hypothetical protein
LAFFQHQPISRPLRRESIVLAQGWSLERKQASSGNHSIPLLSKWIPNMQEMKALQLYPCRQQCRPNCLSTEPEIGMACAVRHLSGKSIKMFRHRMQHNLFQDTMAALALATDPPARSILDRKPDPKSTPLSTISM